MTTQRIQDAPIEFASGNTCCTGRPTTWPLGNMNTFPMSSRDIPANPCYLHNEMCIDTHDQSQKFQSGTHKTLCCSSRWSSVSDKGECRPLHAWSEFDGLLWILWTDSRLCWRLSSCYIPELHKTRVPRPVGAGALSSLEPDGVHEYIVLFYTRKPKQPQLFAGFPTRRMDGLGMIYSSLPNESIPQS